MLGGAGVGVGGVGVGAVLGALPAHCCCCRGPWRGALGPLRGLSPVPVACRGPRRGRPGRCRGSPGPWIPLFAHPNRSSLRLRWLLVRRPGTAPGPRSALAALRGPRSRLRRGLLGLQPWPPVRLGPPQGAGRQGLQPGRWGGPPRPAQVPGSTARCRQRLPGGARPAAQPAPLPRPAAAPRVPRGSPPRIPGRRGSGSGTDSLLDIHPAARGRIQNPGLRHSVAQGGVCGRHRGRIRGVAWGTTLLRCSGPVSTRGRGRARCPPAAQVPRACCPQGALGLSPGRSPRPRPPVGVSFAASESQRPEDLVCRVQRQRSGACLARGRGFCHCCVAVPKSRGWGTDFPWLVHLLWARWGVSGLAQRAGVGAVVLALGAPPAARVARVTPLRGVLLSPSALLQLPGSARRCCRVCACWGAVLSPRLACPAGAACRGGSGGPSQGGVACLRCEGRLVSGAVPSPAARSLGQAAGVPRPVCPGCGWRGRGDPAPAPSLFPRGPALRAVGVAEERPRGGIFRRCEGRLKSGAPSSPAARPPGRLSGPAIHVLLARTRRCVSRALSPGHACPVAAGCRGGGGGPFPGGVACPCCEGGPVSGAVPPLVAHPLGRAAGVPRPVCPGCGWCGRGDPAPVALAGRRCSLWGWRKGVPGGGAFHRCEGRLRSGAPPPPTARPLGGLSGSVTHVLWAQVCGCGGQALSPRLACPVGAACRGGGGGASLGGWPATVVRGVWRQALSLPQPPVLFGGQPWFRDLFVLGAVSADVGTQHRPHNVRPCGPALPAVRVAEWASPGGVPFTVLRGV